MYYILLKSGSKYKKCHVFKHLLHTYASLYDKTKARFGIYTSSWSFYYIWFIQIRQIETDINQLNILGLASILVAVISLNKWELVRTGFLHMSSRQRQG